MINTQLKRKPGKGEGITHTTGSTPSYLMRINILMRRHKAGSHNRVGGSRKPNSVSSSAARLQSSVTIFEHLWSQKCDCGFTETCGDTFLSCGGKSFIINSSHFSLRLPSIPQKKIPQSNTENVWGLRGFSTADWRLNTPPHPPRRPYSFGRLHPESDTSPLLAGRMMKNLKGNRCIKQIAALQESFNFLLLTER